MMNYQKTFLIVLLDVNQLTQQRGHVKRFCLLIAELTMCNDCSMFELQRIVPGWPLTWRTWKTWKSQGI